MKGSYPVAELIAARMRYNQDLSLELIFMITEGPPELEGKRVKILTTPSTEVLFDIEGINGFRTIGEDDDEEFVDEDEEEDDWDIIEDDEEE